jgi:hypothetical protein
MMLPLGMLLAQFLRYSKALENIPRQGKVRRMGEFPMDTSRVIKKDGEVAGGVDGIFIRTVCHGNALFKQKLSIEPIDFLAVARPQRDMMNPGGMVSVIQLAALFGGLYADIAVW